jgi:CubicO group peptidase (beta-lactamase class C family)
MGILLLEHAGKLSLDDKLSRWFPDMAKHVANTVTIRQLLTHTGGLFDHYDYTNTKNMLHAHNADVYAAIKNIDSTYFAPGTHFRYSNTGFCLLALIIEKASGLPYSKYMQQHIFTPAGMLHTTVWGEHANIPNPTMGYDLDSATGKFITSGPEGHPFFSTEGDGGIYTTVDDYLQWFGGLQGSKILPAGIVNEARSLHFTIDTPTHAGYGYGWFVDTGTPPLKVYHSGSNGGYRAYSFTIPAQGYLLLIFSNRGDIDLEYVVKKINEIILGEKGTFTGVGKMVE